MAQTIHSLPMADHQSLAGATPTRILIAEGQGLVRAGLRFLLDRRRDVVVAADAATSAEAIAIANGIRPDVVLMDFDLPGGGGVEATRCIVANGATRVVMLMSTTSDEAVFGALRAGATGLLPRDSEPDQLLAAIDAVAAGEALLAPGFCRRLVDDFAARREPVLTTPRQLEELTAREREVMALVAGGLSNEEIAHRLVVTRATAKTHVSRVLCKLNVRDRAHLVMLAYEAGLVRPGSASPEPHTAPVATYASVTHIGRARSASRRRRGLHPVAA
jgi:DNA-binding NarL/FixJ family response regulator